MGIRTPQPSLKWPRKEEAHFGVKFGLTATMKPKRLLKCGRLTVYMVPSVPITGDTLTPGRCDPQVSPCGGTAVGLGGQGSWLSANTPSQLVGALGTRVE